MYFYPGQGDVSGNHAAAPHRQVSIGTAELAHMLKKTLQMHALHGTFRIL
jgi:hypothetical protein